MASHPRVATLAYDGMTISEIVETMAMLRRHGVSVSTIAPAPRNIRDSSGLTIVPDDAVSRIHDTTFDAILIPGGDPSSVLANDDVRQFVSSVVEDGGVVGTICAGGLIAADAGVTKGRRITHVYRSPWADPPVTSFAEPYFRDSIVEPDRTAGVVYDPPVITALPNATAEFAVAVCVALDLLDAQRGELIARHLRGEFVGELFEADAGA